MSDIDVAIDVTTSVDINWGELGRVFADQSSPDQAAFILGFYEAVVDTQLAFIGSERIFDEADRADVAQFVDNLAYFIREPSGV